MLAFEKKKLSVVPKCHSLLLAYNFSLFVEAANGSYFMLKI